MTKYKLIRVTTVPESFGLLEGQLRFLAQFFDTLLVSSGREELSKIGLKEGVRTRSLNLTRLMSPINDLVCIFRFCCIIYEEKPNIVHSHTPKAGLVAMTSAWLMRVDHRVHTVAGLPLVKFSKKSFKGRLLRFVERWISYCATDVLPNSYKLRDFMIVNELVRKSKTTVLGFGSSNGIDTSYFDPDLFDIITVQKFRNKLSIQGKFVYTYIGRIVRDKGIHELICAFSRMLELKQDIILLVVGYFEDKYDPIDENVKDFIINNESVRYVGFQSDVRPYLASSNVFVFPSYREGFPNAVLQAASMNLFSIVTDINGCNEIIVDGVNGKIIPVQNSDVLFDCMLDSYNNFNSIKIVENSNRNTIINKFNRKFVWTQYLQFYNNLLEIEI